MPKRTLGWIQNPGELKKLKKVVSIFMYESQANIWLLKERLPLLRKYNLISIKDYNHFAELLSQETVEICFSDLKGKGAGSAGRANALCTGIIQAVIEGQKDRAYTDKEGNTCIMKKPYTDDWSAEGYLRWAISCGLIEYRHDSDSCKITELGKQLSLSADNSTEEKEILTIALLSYPPVYRILSLLSDGNSYTKFELGSNLGFLGEMGFTSMPQNVYVYDFCTADNKERALIRSNEEGDSDKYARGIASWLTQMGWVDSHKSDVTETYRGNSYKMKMQKYFITREGEKALKKATGNSSHPKIPKIVLYEMLASNKTPDSDYLRYERASILKSFSNSEKSILQLKNSLQSLKLEISEESIKDHIIGLQSIGINIQKKGDKYKLADKITGLIVPARTSVTKADITMLKDNIRKRLTYIDHKYLVLVDLAYSDATKGKKISDAREFEIQTASLFTKELSFEGMRLGDSNRPDVIISYDNLGAIIDNKSYKDGFSIDKKCADEISRYINENEKRLPNVPKNEWWSNFNTNVDTFFFLFITSFLKGNFVNQLEYISKSQSNIMGGAISVDNLLYIAENLKSGSMQYNEFFLKFRNCEITV